MRSLFVTAVSPWPVDSGNRRRMSSVLRALNLLGPVDVYVLGTGPHPEAADQVSGVVGWGPPPDASPGNVSLLRALLPPSALPTDLARLDRVAPARALARWAAANDLVHDVTWFSRPVAHLATSRSATGVHILDLDDLEDVKLQGRLAADVDETGSWDGPTIPGWRRLARAKMRWNAARWRVLQESLAADATRVVVCSEEDRRRLKSPKVLVFPNCYPTVGGATGSEHGPRPPVLLTVGLMSYRPNADGVRWFCERVLPLVRRALPDVEYRIIGRGVEGLSDLGTLVGVRVVGWVPDIAGELRDADVVVVPARYGGGTRVKILEAWAHHRPVVSTSAGAAGLDARSGEHLLVADDPTALARACVKVLNDPELRAILVSGGAARHADRFRCEDVESELAAEVRELLRSTV